MKLLESTGKTVEEAIAQGLRELDTEREQVDVKIHPLQVLIRYCFIIYKNLNCF
jgi:hypothetical protein